MLAQTLWAAKKASSSSLRWASILSGSGKGAPAFLLKCLDTATTDANNIITGSGTSANHPLFRRQVSPFHSSSSSSGGESTSDISKSATEKQRVPVQVLTLNNLHDNPGAVKMYRRVGRGIGSSKGKTSGRGHKGRKARGGKGIPYVGFEGGQTPLHKRLPKRGFKSKKRDLAAINLGTVQDYIDMGRFPGVGDSENNPITLRHMVQAGLIKPNTTTKRGGLKLLASGKERLTSAVHLLICRASAEAISTVEAAGGSVTTIHYNPIALRQLVRKRREDQVEHRQARPKQKYQPYYTSWNMRGYLHPAMQLRKWFQKKKENNGNGEDLQHKFEEIRKQQEETARVELSNNST